MKKTEVILIGTIHGLHKDNSHYPYEDVFKLIEFYNPDVIGVEIRPEDLNQPRAYLNNYYPYEMVETKFRYEGKYKLYGFDYYEDHLIGKLIPNDYFQTLEKVKLEQAFELDTQFEKEKKLLNVIDQIRMNLILNHTADEVNDGKYDVVCKIYYQQLEIFLQDSPYKRMSDFYKKRDLNIDHHIIHIIRENKGKKLLFLMGCDHRVFAIDAIKEVFSDELIITPVAPKDQYLK